MVVKTRRMVTVMCRCHRHYRSELRQCKYSFTSYIRPQMSRPIRGIYLLIVPYSMSIVIQMIPNKQEVNGTVILPPLVIPGSLFSSSQPCGNLSRLFFWLSSGSLVPLLPSFFRKRLVLIFRPTLMKQSRDDFDKPFWHYDLYFGRKSKII
jgi:hypothetical protein